MIAFCDRESGAIHVAEKKPRGALLIAEHEDVKLLCAAIVASGADRMIRYRGGEKVREELLGIPWYTTAKFPEDGEALVKEFAQKVLVWLRTHPTSQ